MARSPALAGANPWRGGRVVDGSGLENRRAERHRGFESHPLRCLRTRRLFRCHGPLGHLQPPGGLLLAAAADAWELVAGRQAPLGEQQGPAVGAEGSSSIRLVLADRWP